MTPQNFLEALDKTIVMYGGTEPETPTYLRPGNMILVDKVHDLLKQIRCQAATLPCYEQGGIAAEIRNQIDNSPKTPHYRPYEEDEFFAAAQKHGYWMFHKVEGNIVERILPVNVEHGGISFVDWNEVTYGITYRQVMFDCLWADDKSPCGVPTDETDK